MGCPEISAKQCYFLHQAKGTQVRGHHLFWEIYRTLHIVTRILWVSMYSCWSWKNLVLTQLSASLAAFSLVGSSTYQVAKLHWQKYCPWMPAAYIMFSKESFFNPTNLLILMSTATCEIIQGFRASVISGMVKIVLPWN